MAEFASDIIITCDDENVRGGVKRAWVSNVDNVSSFTAGVLHDYTAVVMDTTADVFYEVQGIVETKGLDGENTRENNSSMFENNFEMKIPRLGKTKAKALQDLVDSCKVVLIVEMYESTGTNNKAMVWGWDEVMNDDAGMRATCNETTGKLLADENGYTLTLNNKQTQLGREFVGTIETNIDGTVTFGS